MQMKKYRKPVLFVCFLCLALTCFAQYTVRGGEGTPIRVLDDKGNKIEVWLVYGMENVEISYTSASTSHRWYRFKERILENEPITNSGQNGTTSTIRNLQEGYGYFVEQETVPTSVSVWLIDYSKYLFDINQLEVVSGVDPCFSVKLKGDIEIPNLIYNTPGGRRAQLERSFEIKYNTLKWNEESKSFNNELVELTEAKPYDVNLNAPLCDTWFELKGDAFARHFNKEKTVRAEYSAVAVEAHADTTVHADPFTGMNDGGEGLSAPVSISFRAIANEPVAALYIWKIYRADDENGAENPLIRFPGQEVEYTFSEAGQFVAELEVSNRTVTCTDNTVRYEIKIAESWLKIPNAFSPGASPGENDVFRVGYKSLVKFKGWIFNRWGVQMFHWTDPSQGWDGKKGGKYVPPGVYFYVIEAEGSDKEKYKKSGDINLFRSKKIQDEAVD